MGSWAELVAEADEALDATEALCAVRRRESSRVRRFTCIVGVVSCWQVDVSYYNASLTYQSFLLLLKLHVQLRRSQRTRMA